MKQTHSDLLSKVSKAFDQTLEKLENDVDDPEEMNIEEVTGGTDDAEKDTGAEDLNLNVNCGVCGKTFDDIEALESHIESSHNKSKLEKPPSSGRAVSSFVAKEGGWKCNLCSQVLRTSRALKAHKSRRECPVLQESEKLSGETPEKQMENTETPPVSAPAPAPLRSSARSYSNAGWQQSESRNWAAEFGYNKNSEDEEEEEQEEQDQRTRVQSSVKQSFKPKDILSAMKLNFTSNLADTTSDEEEEDEDEALFAGGKDGRTVSMMNREPRLLSEASRQTRRRLEVLTKQAQEVMAEREKARDEKNKVRREETRAGEKSSNNNKENLVELSSEDEDTEGDKNLLIPLANGWVCEQSKDVTQFWSPEGLSFQTISQIEKYAGKHSLDLDISVFRQAVATVNMTGKTTENNGLATVRIKDEETGLPMVIIFPGGRDCLTMDVSATA